MSAGSANTAGDVLLSGGAGESSLGGSVQLSSGQSDAATLSLVGGYGQSAALNFVNQRMDDESGGMRELRIKTVSDDSGYQTLDFVDAACWEESSVNAAQLAASGLSAAEIAATVAMMSSHGVSSYASEARVVLRVSSRVRVLV
mgnify:CR=1 FL=1